MRNLNLFLQVVVLNKIEYETLMFYMVPNKCDFLLDGNLYYTNILRNERMDNVLRHDKDR